jgi:GNAT superfamily N-acetyltransferase
MPDAWPIVPVPLLATHDPSRFTCGNDSLDHWIRARAGKSEGRSARTYVVCRQAQIIAYYALAMGAETLQKAPGPVRRNMPDPIPLVVLARLAVDHTFQGKGIGAALLRDALVRSCDVAAIVGTRAVIVHAIDDAAAKFYARYGFMEFPHGSRTLFLPMETIAAAITG